DGRPHGDDASAGFGARPAQIHRDAAVLVCGFEHGQCRRDSTRCPYRVAALVTPYLSRVPRARFAHFARRSAGIHAFWILKTELSFNSKNAGNRVPAGAFFPPDSPADAAVNVGGKSCGLRFSPSLSASRLALPWAQ